MQAVDLVADCPLPVVTPPSTPSSTRFSNRSTAFVPNASLESMGQRSSSLLRPKISLTWVLRGEQHPGNTNHSNVNNINRSPDRESLSLEAKDRSFRRSVKSVKSIKSVSSVNSVKCIKNAKTVNEKDKAKEETVLQRIEKVK